MLHVVEQNFFTEAQPEFQRRCGILLSGKFWLGVLSLFTIGTMVVNEETSECYWLETTR
jgi:hypothetical protein